MDKFEKYLELLVRQNAVMNLTAIREPEEIRIRHFEDSLNLLNCADFKNKRLLDVGSGAGFPGLPLKFSEPSICLTMLDSTAKKVEFLQNVCNELGIQANCVHARAEEFAHTKTRESFDIVTARGVSALPALAELCLPLVKPGGLFLAMKETAEESASVRKLGGEMLDPFYYELSNGIKHCVIMVKKTEPTPKEYPRKWAAIKSKPL